MHSDMVDDIKRLFWLLFALVLLVIATNSVQAQDYLGEIQDAWQIAPFAEAIPIDIELAKILVADALSSPREYNAYADADHWYENGIPTDIEYSHIFRYRDRRVIFAPINGQTLVIITKPASVGRDGIDWHCQSVWVIDKVFK